MTQKTPLDRRGFMRIAGTYGLSSTAFAVAGMVGPLTSKASAARRPRPPTTAARTHRSKR